MPRATERQSSRHNYYHHSPSTASNTSSNGNSFFSPIHQRLIDWEGRLRRWKFFRGTPRSTSSDPKSIKAFNQIPLESVHSNNNNHLRKRPTDLPVGSFTCPIPRRNMNLQGNWRPRVINTEPDRPLLSEEEMNQRYREIQERSGVIEIGPQRYEGIKIENLILKSELGSGACGSVTKRVLDNRFIAVKEMKRSDNNQETKRIFTDLQVIRKSNDCPYIVGCYGYILTYDHVYICMEMMAMCLEKLYKQHLMPQHSHIPEEILGRITVSVTYALKYLKDHHEIIHRDVKPSNILIDWNGNIKLCDFGIAGQLIDSMASTQSVGCTAYLSPERLKGGHQYDVRADIWSLGITLIELAMFQYPYKFDTPFGLMLTITEDPAPRLPEGFSLEMRSFVDKCLEKDQERRPKYNILVKDPWFIKHENLEVDIGGWLEENLSCEDDGHWSR